jgi:cytoskeletal protein CcmA (bactofilin family)
MAWFKKPEEGDTQMTNGNFSGRSGSETVTRPEPRAEAPVPRAEGPTPPPRAEALAPVTRPTETRPAEVRAPEVRAPAAAPRASVLGPTLRFRGELSAQEDLVVQGSVEGSITHAQSLTIGSDGSMKGDIRARLIVIDGKVEGDLFATDSVTLRASGKVRGNLFAPRIAIHEGALFQGRVEMRSAGAAVREPGARLPQDAESAAQLEAPAVDQMLSGTGG